MHKQILIIRKAIPEILVFLMIAVLGVVYIHYVRMKIKNEQFDNVLQIARYIETTIPKEDLKVLDAKPGDIDKPQYQRIQNTLKAIIRINPKARFAYIYTRQNGKLFFIADSEPEDSRDYSPPGQEYTEADVSYYQPFKNGKEFITGSVTDRWGTWISVLIPIKDEATGRTFAVFAMDFNSKSWDNSLQFEAIQSSVLIILLLLALFFSFKIKARNNSLKNEIIHRKQTEGELEESREKYRGLFEAAFEAIFISEKGLCIEQNQRAEIMFGYSSEEAIGRYGTEWIVPEDREMVMQNMLKGYEDAYEARAMKKDGTTFPCVLQGKMMHYKGRNVRVTSLTDITDHKLAEQTLFQSRERARLQRNAIARIAEDEVISFGDVTASFHRLTEEIADAIQIERASVWLFSEDKTILRCMSLFESKTKKHSSGEILSHADYPRYFESINRESRIYASDAQNDPRTSEFKEGYLVPKGISSMLDAGIYSEGELKGVVCLEHTGEMRTWYSDEESFASTMASIIAQTLANNKRKHTEEALRLSEEKYRTIFENVQDVFYQTDLDWIVQEISLSITHVFGFSRDEIIGSPLFNLHDDPYERAVLLNEIAKTGDIREYEIKLKTKSGEIKHASINARLISDADGRPHHIDGAIRDITDRKNSEEAIKEALAKAEAGNRLKTAFINNISHEIRTPLNGILGFSNLIILPDISDEEKEQFLTLIKASSDRLIHTITDYMDISLIASGNMEVNCKPFDHQKMLHQLGEQFRPLCAVKNIALHLEIPVKTEGISLYSDAELFQKAFSHLLDNAVKFTQKGEITFGFTQKPGIMEFFVKDTGAGISKEAQARIFDDFVQEELSLTRGYEGNGLGLSIARGLIHMLGGDISVKSEKGKGSIFMFNLPFDEKNIVIPTDTKVVNTVPVIAKPVILIAEDDESNLFYLQAILMKMNIALIPASNGKEAVEKCHNHPEISLVLMDLKMPVKDGFDATREIKSFRKNIPVIAITAFAMNDDKKKAAEAGCDDYLFKPVNREALSDKLKKYGIMI